MAVDRKLLQQALLNAQGISKRAEAGTGFDPRGGAGVAALQIATAGIGAFAQNRARKDLEADKANRTAAFEARNPNLKGMNFSPETQEAIGLAQVNAQLKQQFAAPKEPKFEIKEGEGGFFRVNPQTGETFPITGQAGSQLRGKPSKSLVEVNTGKLESEEQKSLGKIFAKKFEDITNAGDAAQRGLETLQTLEKAVNNPDAVQGAFAGIRADSKQIADLFGFETKGLEDDAIINSVGNKLALQLRNPKGEDGGLTGATSDKDIKFLVAGVPNKDKTRSQNLALIEIGKKDKERTIRLKQLANNYLDNKGTFKGFAKVKKRFYEENPLFEEDSDDKDRIKSMLKGDDSFIPLYNRPSSQTPSGFEVLEVREE